MGVLKEEFHEFAKIADRQGRLYADACDVGIVVNDRQLAALRALVVDLNKSLYTRTTFWGETPKKSQTLWGSTWECLFPWEEEGSYVMGTMVKVHYNHTYAAGSWHDTIMVEMEAKAIDKTKEDWGWRK